MRCLQPIIIFFIILFISIINTNIINAQTERPLRENKLQRPFNNTISALFVFGDSTVDSGNNNYIQTLSKCNFPPYGKDFVNHNPTGRFTNGRLVTDFVASYVGIKEFIPPYLDPNLSLEELKTGVSFASGGSGYDSITAQISGSIPLQKQLEYFKEYKKRLENAIGEERTKYIIRKAAFLISAGTNDFVLNYFGTQFRRQTYSVTGYQSFLLQQVQQHVQGLMAEGARLIGVVGVPPLGCLPVVINMNTGNPLQPRECIDKYSAVGKEYNVLLQNMLKKIQIHGTRLVYADIYTPLNDMVKYPNHYGFDDVSTGCCTRGLLKFAVFCIPNSIVCNDASKYTFWDAVHPTETTYYNLFMSLRPTIDSFINQ